MNVLNIALHEIKITLRDRRTFVFMLAFPIVLMLILGTALSNAFSSNYAVGDLKLLVEQKATGQALIEYWNGFSEAAAKEGIEIVPAAGGQDGQADVRDGKYTGYAELGDDGIRYYGNSKTQIESNIIQGMLTSFADKVNLVLAAQAIAPEKTGALLQEASAGGGYVQESSLDPDRQPGSMDYYALAMTTMIALYSSMSAGMLIQGERLRNTAVRLMAAPVGKSEIFAGKVIGNTIINYALVVVVFLFSKLVFKADWGAHSGIVLLVLLTEVLLAVSVGLGFSYLFKGNSARSVLLIVVQIASFLGGAYFPIGDVSGVVGTLANLSPLRWTNEALTNVIYNNDLQSAWPVVLLNAGIAIVFLAFANISIRRREAL